MHPAAAADDQRGVSHHFVIALERHMRSGNGIAK
jgi:hypothetical protein